MAQTIKLRRSGTQGAIPSTAQLELGEVAINTYDGKMYIKKDVGGTESVVEIGPDVDFGNAIITRGIDTYIYTATSSQTTFSGLDNSSETLSYTVDQIQVFLNGVLLDSSEYTASNGTSVVLSAGAATDDIITVIAFYSDDIDSVGNLNITGNITLSGTVDGRDIAADGSKLDGIEASADVTDTANVTAAGALMDSEVTNLAQVKAFDSSDYATAAQGATADSAVQNLSDLSITATAAEINALDGITATTTELNYTDGVTSNIQTQLDTKSPIASPTFTGTVTADGLSLGDNDKATFGFGNDLQIYHNNSGSYIEEQGPGSLYIRGSNQLFLQSSTGDNYLAANSGGALNLSYDGSIKLATTATGINVTGTATMDGLTVDGSATIQASSSPALIVKDTTNNAEARLQAFNSTATVGTQSNHSFSIETNDTTRALFATDGDISFYEDTGTTEKLTWDASAESLNFADNGKATFGAGNDLEIYHDGSNSYISDVGTGDLKIQGANLRLENPSGVRYFQGSSGISYLYNSGDIKLNTTSTGIDVTGTVTADVVSVSQSTAGTASLSVTNSAGFAGNALIAEFIGDSDSIQIRNDAAGDYKILNSEQNNGISIYDGTGGVKLRYNGTDVAGVDSSGGFEVTSGGLNVTGNITVSGTVDGRDVAADGTKLDGIEPGATADQTAAEILTAIKTVDGSGSGLDADLLDGQQGSYYTGYTDTAIANLVDSAPATLDTLNELAAALGDDANFSTTVTNSIATKLSLSGGTMTGNIALGDNNLTGIGKLNFNNHEGSDYGSTGDVMFDENFYSDTEYGSTSIWSGSNGGGLAVYNEDGWGRIITDRNMPWLTATFAGLSVTGNITVSGTVDGRDVATDGTKLDGIESGATADQTASEILTAIKTVDGTGSGLDADLLDGISSSSFLRSDVDDDFTSTLKHNNNGGTALFVRGGPSTDTTVFRVSAADNDEVESSLGDYGFSLRYMGSRSGVENSLSIFADNQAAATQIESLKINQDGVMYRGTNRLFDDGYHPNADTLTTARNIALTGAVTGNANFDGSGNISIATTATADPTLTLSGDATGSATFTNLGNATLTVVVANDSHTHDGRYYTESEADSRFVNVTGDAMSGNLTITGALTATSKSFVIDHPTKPDMKLRYGSLEGPENGVYVRGRLKDNNVIELPDYWTGLVDEDTITVNLTAIGRGQDLWVEDVAENKVTVGGENINCFYTVFAERKDVERFEVEYEA